MILVDAHCHLDDESFRDLGSVIERARESGVRHCVTNGANTETNRKALEIAAKFRDVLAATGIYPVNASKMSEEELDKAEEFIEEHINEAAAIGEVGLDGKHADKNNPLMREAFRRMVLLAKKAGKTLQVHSRAAEEETIEMLESLEAKRVMMHCFGGSMKLVRRVVENGWFLSIPANVVYSTHFQSIVKLCPLSRLLTETDSPFLSPVKGERNEPRNVSFGIKKIAEIKGVSEEEAAKAVFMNFQRLFL